MDQKLFGINLALAVLLNFLICEGQCKGFPRDEEGRTLTQYPGLFKTEHEINILRAAAARQDKTRSWKPLLSLGGSMSTNEKKYTLSASLDEPWSTLYHACCASNRTFKDFDKMKDQRGRTVTIVQFKKYKQYIEMDTCVTTPGCKINCKCGKESRFYTALIENPDYPRNSDQRRIFDIVQTPAICRCVNNAATSAKRSEL